MSSLRLRIGHIIGLGIAILYTLAGQAHFTDKLTPGLAATIDEMTPRSFKVLPTYGLSYDAAKQVYGAFDLVGAALLYRSATRRAGLNMAIVGFSMGLYAQVMSGGDVTQVGLFSVLAVLGRLLLI